MVQALISITVSNTKIIYNYFGDVHSDEAGDKPGGRNEAGLTIQQLDPVHINGLTHNGKVNGFSQHTINITSNPLAETSQDKVSFF